MISSSDFRFLYSVVFDLSHAGDLLRSAALIIGVDLIRKHHIDPMQQFHDAVWYHSEHSYLNFEGQMVDKLWIKERLNNKTEKIFWIWGPK